MKALLLGLIIIAAAVAAVLPAGLNWGENVLIFLQGALPVAAVFIGLLAVFIGVAAIKDQAETRKEENARPPQA